jgi:hypothetical protein
MILDEELRRKRQTDQQLKLGQNNPVGWRILSNQPGNYV